MHSVIQIRKGDFGRDGRPGDFSDSHWHFGLRVALAIAAVAIAMLLMTGDIPAFSFPLGGAPELGSVPTPIGAVLAQL